MPIGRGYQPMRPGQPLTARQFNTNARGAMQGQQISGNADKRVTRNGVAFNLPDAATQTGASLYQKWAIVADVFEDYLEVTSYAPAADSTSGANFYVAKPFLLQQAPLDGQAITYIDGDVITYTKDATDPEYKRNHDDGSTDADFVITPNYYVGEPIIILRMPTNVVVDGVALQWIEMAPGRYWARV